MHSGMQQPIAFFFHKANFRTLFNMKTCPKDMFCFNSQTLKIFACMCETVNLFLSLVHANTCIFKTNHVIDVDRSQIGLDYRTIGQVYIWTAINTKIAMF